MPKPVKKNDECPCGSKLLAKDCCYPAKPPIKMTSPPYILGATVPSSDIVIHTNAPKEIANQLTEVLRSRLQPQSVTLTYANESGPGMLSRKQVNPQIADVLGYDLNGYYLDKHREENSLLSPLHVSWLSFLQARQD